MGEERHPIVRNFTSTRSWAYKQSLGLRITGAYPFTGPMLIVNRRFYHPEQKDTWRMQED